VPVPIKHNDRVFIQGKTDSGKTALARYLFNSFFGTRRTCIDPKGRLQLNAPVARAPHELDLAAPVSHYIPGELEDEEYEEVFRRLWWARGPRLLWIDESCGPTRAGYAPKHLRFIIQQGREEDMGLIACSQRPVNVEMTLRSEAEHVFIFVPRTTKSDVKTIAGDIGREPDELAAELDALLVEHGPWSHLWYCRNTNELTRCAPLPASVVAGPGGSPPTPAEPPREPATQADEDGE
jgi:hypothetical protein